MDKRFQIGQFAKLVGISVKTLRFYSDEGLLEPDHVDAFSGYRYYKASQLEQANRILNLRATGISLADLRQLLANTNLQSNDIKSALNKQRAALAHDLALTKLKLAATEMLIHALDKAKSEALGNLRICITEPQFALVKRRSTEEHATTVMDLFELAEQQVGAVNGRSERSPMLISWNETTQQQADIAVCIPVLDHAVEILGAEVVDGYGLSIAVSHKGAYSGLENVEALLRQTAVHAGMLASDETRTIYRRFGANQIGYTLPKSALAKTKDQFMTDIQIPVRLFSD